MENHRKVRLPVVAAMLVMFCASPASARAAVCRTAPVYQFLFDEIRQPPRGRIVLEVSFRDLGMTPPRRRGEAPRLAQVRRVVRGNFRGGSVPVLLPGGECGVVEPRLSGMMMGRLERLPSGEQVFAPFSARSKLGWRPPREIQVKAAPPTRVKAAKRRAKPVVQARPKAVPKPRRAA